MAPSAVWLCLTSGGFSLQPERRAAPVTATIKAVRDVIMGASPGWFSLGNKDDQRAGRAVAMAAGLQPHLGPRRLDFRRRADLRRHAAQHQPIALDRMNGFPRPRGSGRPGFTA